MVGFYHQSNILYQRSPDTGNSVNSLERKCFPRLTVEKFTWEGGRHPQGIIDGRPLRTFFGACVTHTGSSTGNHHTFHNDTSCSMSSNLGLMKNVTRSNLHSTFKSINQSINHFIVLKKDMHYTTHDLQYVGWSQQNEFQMYPL